MGLVSTQAVRKCSTQRKHGVHIIQDYTGREHSELQELPGHGPCEPREQEDKEDEK